jgi:putative membrane protein
MTKERICRSILLGSASMLLALPAAVAQNQPGGATQQQPNMPSQQPTSPTAGTMGPNATTGNQQGMIDQSFVKKALEGGTAEVQLGQLAQQKSQSEELSSLGRRWWKTTPG